jgi:serine protease Do
MSRVRSRIFKRSDESLDRFFAEGNSFRLKPTFNVGVVSALGRRVRVVKNACMEKLIQTDASINPGNSGGHLVNVDGKDIGINTAIFQQTWGIGFVVTVNRVRWMVEDLVCYSEVVPAWLGLELQDMNYRLPPTSAWQSPDAP